MDEIDYKLKSQDPALISHAISKLIETTKKKLENEEKDISKILEFQLLSSKCNSDDFIVSTSACQALVIFVESKLWDVKSALATFMACLSSSKNYQAITIATSQLLMLDWKTCNKRKKYMLEVPNQHPFITILNQEKHNWRSVLNQMKLIMHHHDKHIVELLRPVFVHVLCDPCTDWLDSCKREMWQFVIKSDYASDLKIEILLWLCTNRADNCIDTNCRVLELAEISLLKADKEYCTALIPLIASLTIQLLEYGHEPVQNFCAMFDLIEQCHDYIGNITIILMTEIILICPAAHLFNVLQICAIIVDKMPCNIILLNALSASLIKWFAYPSLLCLEALGVAKELFIKISVKGKTDNSDDIITNKVLLMFGHSNRYIQFYMELIRNLQFLENNTLSWLNNLSFAPINLQYMCKLILCGIFLYSDEPLVIQKTCHILMQITQEINSFASHMLSLLLHKLTKSHDSATMKYLLLIFPNLAIYKENLPIVVHTLNILLNSGKPLKYFAIQLYSKVLEKEPRCYRFLSTAIVDTLENDRDWHSDVTCAHAIENICKTRPEYGEELIPLLSQILNRCVDLNGGAASALALNSISVLCQSAVISVSSTWQVIAPKMRQETRSIVVESLCELLAEVPSFPFRTGDDYDKFIDDVVTHLWSYVLSRDTKIAKSAFKALKSYRLECVPLSALPQDFRLNFMKPQASSEKPVHETDKSECALQYIPGSCWIQMLKTVNKNVLSAAGNLLIYYIENELNGFRSRIYTWPQGEPQNFKYLPERSVIRAVGEYLRRGDKSDVNNQRVMMECLRIFAYKYKKPLPNIKWDFLKEIMKISEEAKEYSLSIVSRHSQISSSAKQLTEDFLSMYTCVSKAGQLLLNEKHIILYSNLDELCQAIQPTNLKQFLQTSLTYTINGMSYNNEKSIDLFNCIMSSYVVALKSDVIQIGNRTLLTTILEELFDKVDLTSKRYEKYFTAVMEMSIKDIERMTSPNVWRITVPEKLKNAIIIRTELTFTRFIDIPLTWLNELIVAVASDSEMQKYFLENIQTIQTNLRLEKCHDFTSQKDWILDFMSRIDILIMEDTLVTGENKSNIGFYCDILFVMIICLSGVDCLLSKKELLITSQDIRIKLFPQAISILIDRQIWKSTTRQIMKWLNHMRTNSILGAYTFAFQNALISLRYKEDYNSQWSECLSIKTLIHT